MALTATAAPKVPLSGVLRVINVAHVLPGVFDCCTTGVGGLKSFGGCIEPIAESGRAGFESFIDNLR